MNSTLKTTPLLLFPILLALLGAPFVSDARTVIRSGDTVSVGQDQLVEGDLYTAGEIVNISGRIEEDLLVAAGEININGEVAEDALLIGGNVDVNGVIGDDLRIMGGNVIIAEPVLGDVFVVAGNVKVLSTASVTGDLTIVGGSAEISGVVEGRVLGWIDTLRIDSEVRGDVEVTTTNLTLGDRAVIGGTVQYVSQRQLVRSQSATISGEVVRNDPVIMQEPSSYVSYLLPILVLLFSIAVWYLLSRRTLQRVTNRALMPGIRSVLIGGSTMVLAPFAISILLVSMLGSLAGFVLLTAFMLFIALAFIAIPATIGQFCLLVAQKEVASVSLLTLLIGTGITAVLFVVPVIGPTIIFGFMILTFGALIDLLLRANR